MSKRVALTLAGPGFLLLGCFLTLDLPFAFGQDTKAPDWKHGLEFGVRKADEKDFTKDTKRFGTEVFVDKNLNNVVYMSETASIGLLPGSAAPTGKDIKDPKWSHGLMFKVRKGGASDFDKEVKKFGLEVYRDENTGSLVYVSETGSLAVGTGNAVSGTEIKSPKWSHGLDLRVRKGGELDFTDKTTKFGVEVYRDENNGLLVYISETGSVAVVPGNAPTGDTKKPKWSHGFNFRVRKAGEPDTTKNTRSFGAEVFQDPNTGMLVYITETGDLALAPGNVASTTETKKPKWLHGVDFKVRKGGEKDFTDATKKWGVEVFRDENVPNVIYITETGAVAVLPAK